MTRNYDVEYIIKRVFGPRPNQELTNIPKGWNDGFTRGIQTATVNFLAYKIREGQILKHEEPEEHIRFLERNLETDPEDKLLKKQIENIINMKNFKEWLI